MDIIMVYSTTTYCVWTAPTNFIISVYTQRFAAHLWNNVRSSRLRLHQVILRQCHIYVPTLSPQDRDSWQIQIEHSEAQIEHFSLEIAATVPQLAGYHQQLEDRRLSNQPLPVRVTKSPEVQPAKTLRHGPKIRNSGSMQYNTRFGDEPSPFRRGVTPAKKTREMSVSYADCNDGELQVDAPVQITRPGAGPQPASVYHMLFQLYSLRSITTLSDTFRDWIHGRIRWMENMTNTDDLARLQAMVAERPGDGFPIGEGG
jgi:hypothetical protein